MSPSAKTINERPGPADLTIALCSIGRQGYLQESLLSLERTTPPGVTLSIVLNAPDDDKLVADVESIRKRWDGPSDLVVLNERVSIAASHNTALRRAKTDFITFMGDDDLVLEPRVQRLLDLFWTTVPTPAVIGSFCRRASGSPDNPAFSTNKDYGPSTVAEWEAYRESGELIEIVFPAAIYRTERLRAIDGFEDRFALAFDVATFTILGQNEPVLADPRRSFAHRIHDGSVSSFQSGEHASRLGYLEACVRALREGRNQPSWDAFVSEQAGMGRLQRMNMERKYMSSILFRNGGAATYSGRRLTGATRLLGSLALSPRSFFTRARAQTDSGAGGEKVVTIMLKNCNQYRVAFYNELRRVLSLRSIELRLVFADGMSEDIARGDTATIEWAEIRPFRSFSLGGKRVLWQPGFDLALAADLMITEQASKHLFNVVLAYGQRPFRTRHAYWGHGRNFQASIEGGGGETLKRRLTKRAHWFFAYNDVSALAAIEAGMPADRVTAVMNATDTEQIRRVRATLDANTAAAVRSELGIGPGPVGLHLGGLYPLKRPAFLIESARAIRRLVPSFELLVIGDGSEASIVRDAAIADPWIHHVGARYDDERIRLASVSDVHLMSGMVGLNVVDAFALGLPTVAVDLPYHSPEIEYLRPGENGEMVPAGASPDDYATAVAELLQDRPRLERLSAAAETAGRGLTVEAMAQNFADGIESALAAPTRK